MTIEKFLQFWNQHNPLIIEGLIGLIILMSLFLAYRSFFSKKAQHAETEASAGGGGVDAGQLEKTLQKILENQNLNAKLSANDDLSVEAPMPEVPAGDGEPTPEVTQLRATLSDSNKKIQILQTQLAQAQEQATQAQAQAAAAASSAPAPAAGGAAGISTEERDELNAKLRDLEARLAEYEIISEDIADLSRYREENDDLKKQIEALKSQTVPVAAAAPAAPAPTPAPEPVAAAPAPTPGPEPVAAPAAEAAPKSAQDEVDAAMNAAVLEMTPQSTEPAPPPADLIDDDLMKEFAAAVEGQKALDQAAQKAGDGSEKATTNTDDTDKLMSDFENFVGNKKS